MLLFLESILILAWTRLLLRVAPARALRGALGSDSERSVGGDGRVVVQAFNRAARLAPFGHTCLHRALAVQRMLLRRGVTTNLRIGLGRKPNLFPGHAWLESDGALVNDDAETVARYVPLTISESALRMAFE